MKNLILILISLFVISVSYVTGSNVTEAILIGTAAGGIGTAFAFNMTYLPEFITWNDAGNAINFLRVDTQERGVLLNLVAADIVPLNGILGVGAMAANDNRLILADGHIKNMNVIISGTTSAVGAINFFGSSDNTGVSMFKYTNFNLIAGNETQFSKFSMLSLYTTVTVTDFIRVAYKDGHVQLYDAFEIQNLSTLWNDAPTITINNLAGNIETVSVVSALGGAGVLVKVDI